MTDAAPDGPPAMPFAAAAAQARRRADDDPLGAARCSRSPTCCSIARKVGATLVEKGAEIWADPAKAVALAEQGGALTAEIAKLALMGAGFADALQGHARRRASASRGPSRFRSTR